jgi:biofilm PGA synthesis N-glycosyltransferase PgaC
MIDDVVLVVLLALLAWGNGGYLLALRLLEAVMPGVRRHPALPAEESEPAVTVIVFAYDEEDTIEEKLDNVLALDYPVDKLSVVVASDGSIDRTNEIVRAYPSQRVSLLAYPVRRGKALVTNDVFAFATDEWLLTTDADARMSEDFLRVILPHLRRPDVGVVDGRMICVNREVSSIATDVGLHWRLESALKTAESKFGLLASTFGPCTAVRRSIFRNLRSTEDIDFITPLDALAAGYRVVHEPSATVTEFAHDGVAEQFKARVRMVTKNFPGTVRKLWPLRRRPLVVFGIVSHKVLRWLTPSLLIALFAFSVTENGVLGRGVLVGEIALYAGGLVGAIAWRVGRNVPAASTAFSFLVANAGFLVGTFRALRGTKVAVWEPHHAASLAEGE